MALKKFRPLTPSLRITLGPDFSEITKSRPEKSLTQAVRKSGGRNNHGRVTSRNRSGGHRRRYRIIDWKRRKHGVSAKVIGIEYDPNRSAHIALLEYEDKERTYILAPKGLQAGDTIQSGPEVAAKLGNCLPMRSIPVGLDIHNIELKPGKGAQMVRTAGSSATIMGVDENYAQIKLPSGEIRKVLADCYATVGQLGNSRHSDVHRGKAGRTRWLGRKPITRAMARNPHDHPMGGGEGKSKSGGGRQHPVSPWGQVAKGFKTRKKHNVTNKFIIQRRKKK